MHHSDKENTKTDLFGAEMVAAKTAIRPVRQLHKRAVDGKPLGL